MFDRMWGVWESIEHRRLVKAFSTYVNFKESIMLKLA